jgi:hypothetical protein
VLANRTAAGELQLLTDLCFHGGPGQTLEMRLFGKEALVAHLESAGFERIEFGESYPEYGIICEPWSRWPRRVAQMRRVGAGSRNSG